MSTFEQLVAMPGVGTAYLVNVSLDRGDTIAYRYSTHSVPAGVGVLYYEPRLVKVSTLSRGLSIDHGLSSSTVSIVLENTDGGVDWVSNQATAGTTFFRSQWALSIYVWDPANPADFATKTLGIFQAMDNPVRTLEHVEISLADRAISDASDFSQTPTLRDIEADLQADGCFMSSWDTVGGGIDDDVRELAIDPDLPLPLVFGEAAKLMPVFTARSWNQGAADTDMYVPFIVCCTTDTAAVTAADVTRVELPDSPIGVVPKRAPQLGSGFPDVWEVRKSSTITKDGKDWKVIYVRINMGSLGALNLILNGERSEGQNLITPDDWARPMWVGGSPFSSRTLGTGTARATGGQIAKDLLLEYSRGLVSGDVDSTSFDNVIDQQVANSAHGTVDGNQIGRVDLTKTTSVVGTLRAAIADAAAAGGFDIFTSWDGRFTALSFLNGFDEQTSTFVELDETLIKRNTFVERVPSLGQRWAPWNRLYVQTLGARIGPYDIQTAIDEWDRVLTKTINGKWMGRALILRQDQQYPPSEYTYITARFLADSTVRPVITFGYSLEALSLEIGTFFTVNWTRGDNMPLYEDAIFRVEGLSLHCEGGFVEVTAVWMDDLRTQPPYLLDDETFLTKATGSGGRTATVTTGSTTVAFSSGSLVSDGIAAGDMLVISDSSEAHTSFKRWRVLRVASVTDATHLVYTDPSTDFGAAGPYALSAWTIQRGYSTYPTSGSDPTNYPFSGGMYGKLSDDDDTYSDDSPANLLITG